jgi:uncharacterized protein DUF4234
MAEEIQIAGSGEKAKIRNPLAPALLPFVTFGIYALVWYYKINKEMAEMGKARNTEELGTSPTTSLMAVLFGWIIIVPPFLSFYNTWKRKVAAERLTGQDGMEAGLGFLLTILISPVGYYLLQRDLNDVLTAQAGGGGSTLPPPPPAPPVQSETPAQPATPPPAEPPAGSSS